MATPTQPGTPATRRGRGRLVPGPVTAFELGGHIFDHAPSRWDDPAGKFPLRAQLESGHISNTNLITQWHVDDNDRAFVRVHVLAEEPIMRRSAGPDGLDHITSRNGELHFPGVVDESQHAGNLGTELVPVIEPFMLNVGRPYDVVTARRLVLDELNRRGPELLPDYPWSGSVESR